MNSEIWKISVVIPTLNESDQIQKCLHKLQSLRRLGNEVIVVDGGSDDNTVSLAIPLCDRVIQAEISRSIQMNAGAAIASGHCILFLHADTLLPDNVFQLFEPLEHLDNLWGRFDMRLSGKQIILRVIEKCMNLRSRITGIATGDQAIFVSKDLFNKIGGFPELGLMEDIALCKLLKKFSDPICLNETVTSSSRRWEQHGILKTILKMWSLRLLFFLRYDTQKLAKFYQ